MAIKEGARTLYLSKPNINYENERYTALFNPSTICISNRSEFPAVATAGCSIAVSHEGKDRTSKR